MGDYPVAEGKGRSVRYRVWDAVHNTMLTPGHSPYPYANPNWEEFYRFALLPNGDGLLYPVLAPDGVQPFVLDRDQFVVMLSTGISDKNGQEIFEGDVVAWQDWQGGMQTALLGQEHVMVFVHFATSGEVAVLGNIYENPEIKPGEIRGEFG